MSSSGIGVHFQDVIRERKRENKGSLGKDINKGWELYVSPFTVTYTADLS